MFFFIVGRTNQLSFYIKLGTPANQQTFVEVDLYESTDKFITIRRVLNAENNSSVWYLNSVQKKMSEIKAVVRALAIDVDNLCSFMPQDRVGAFSSYTGKEILQNTLKSIRSPAEEVNLYEEQKELSDLELLRERCRMNRDAIQKKYDDSRRELDSLQSELQRLERRKEAIVKLKLFKVKLNFVQCNSAKVAWDEREAELKSFEEEMRDKKAALAPLEQELARNLKALDMLQQCNGNGNNNSSSSSKPSKVDKNATISKQSKILLDRLHLVPGEQRARDEATEEASAEISTMEARRQEEIKRLERIQREIAQTSAKLTEIEAELPNLEAENRQKNEQMAELVHQTGDLEQQRIECQRQLQENQQQVSRLARDLENVKDLRQIYRQRLYQSNHAASMEVVRVMDWLDENMSTLKERGLLTGDVHGPVGMLISVQDPAYAAMVEKLVGPIKGHGFLVENDADFQFLRNAFSDQLRVKINIYKIECYKVLNQRRVYDAQQLHQFRSFGVLGYLSDQVQCSDIVRAFLYSFTPLSTALCGNSETDRLGNEEFAALCQNTSQSFRLFMQLTRDTGRRSSGGSGQFQGAIVDISGKRSRYNASAPPSISSSSVLPGRGLITGYSGDSTSASSANELQQRKQQIESEIQQCHTLIRQANDTIQHISNERLALDTQRGVLLHFRAAYTQKKNEPVQLKRKLQELAKQQGDAERKLTDDVVLVKDRQRLKYIQEMNKLIDSLAQGLSVADQTLSLLPVKSVSKMKVVVLEEMIAKTQQSLDEQKLIVIKLRKAIEKKKVECQHFERKFQEKEKILEELMEEEGDSDRFMNEVFPQAQQVCTSENERDIETLMLQCEAEINSIVDNPGLLARQQVLVDTLQDLTAQLQASNAEHEQAENSLLSRKDRWLESVRALQHKLHIVFQAYMKELLFDGEVLLREQGTFLDYELVLMVKFRKEAPLSALSAQKHSGGERAVSTIMFLMALQDMTQSPFRVVDEINQGMDERNERLVFDRIVRNCCGDFLPSTNESTAQDPNTRDIAKYAPLWRPQYFLITPKLLPNLLSLKHPDVTVLLVRSGAGLRDVHWSFSDMAAKYLERIGGAPLPTKPRLSVTSASHSTTSLVKHASQLTLQEPSSHFSYNSDDNSIDEEERSDWLNQNKIGHNSSRNTRSQQSHLSINNNCSSGALSRPRTSVTATSNSNNNIKVLKPLSTISGWLNVKNEQIVADKERGTKRKLPTSSASDASSTSKSTSAIAVKAEPKRKFVQPSNNSSSNKTGEKTGKSSKEEAEGANDQDDGALIGSIIDLSFDLDDDDGNNKKNSNHNNNNRHDTENVSASVANKRLCKAASSLPKTRAEVKPELNLRTRTASSQRQKPEVIIDLT